MPFFKKIVRFFRRTTLTSTLAPEDYTMWDGIPVFTDDAMEARLNSKICINLEDRDTVLSCFASSDCKLHGETKHFEIAMNQTKTMLTPEMITELTFWMDEYSKAKTIRVRANREPINYEAVLNGAVVVKRYALYLTTQSTELMPKP
ncbi:hypothetical protein CRE_07463 [Caenorhabditis remanei]|uniref:Uncharacterized protein n=1 Tax=Caenorhabditis remanei TaxID=31234 RepID=E3M2P1_CAERE|nr:hypothetical protein CRE_07463 [Caenorhabditis remanei]